MPYPIAGVADLRVSGLDRRRQHVQPRAGILEACEHRLQGLILRRVAAGGRPHLEAPRGRLQLPDLLRARAVESCTCEANKSCECKAKKSWAKPLTLPDTNEINFR